jgi:hypothetical protein
MADSTFADGYRDGWESVAGLRPLPDHPTAAQEGEVADYACGFRYGKSDAAERFEPDGTDLPRPSQGSEIRSRCFHAWLSHPKGRKGWGSPAIAWPIGD